MTVAEGSLDSAVLEHQSRLLEGLASGTPPERILAGLAESLESLMPGVRCSILLVDDAARTLRHGTAPHLPVEYTRAIDGIAIGPMTGSCGAAAHLGRVVIARDTTTDPRWAPFRLLAERHGLRACWSSPIAAPEGGVLGTFAVYHDEPHEPTEGEIALLARFSALSAIAIRHAAMLRTLAERHRADEDRRAAEAARAVAEERSRAKGQLLSAMSHELRTPMSSITGFAELLRTVDLPAERRDAAVAHMAEAAQHILDLVEDLLDLAKLDAGAVQVRREPTDVDPVLEEVVRVLEPLALEHRVEVRCERTALRATADRRRLRQALLNLVANAVKYNHTGGWVRLGAGADGPGRVRISVRDGGPGLPAAAEERLFVPFERLGAERGPVPGTGLGLTVSKQFVEAMGGELRIERPVGAGTAVVVELPASPPPG